MIDIRVPEAGESITQVELAKWLAEDGDYIEKDQELAEIDSDKATLTISAQASGVLKIIVDEGTTIEPGKVIGQIDESAERKQKPADEKKDVAPAADRVTEDQIQEKKQEAEPLPAAQEKETESPVTTPSQPKTPVASEFTLSPQASKLLDELHVSLDDIDQNPFNKRITKKDILLAIAALGSSKAPAEGAPVWKGSREVERIKMTTLRRKIAERLVAVKNETAMLTTFNEVDMSALVALRNRYKDKFQQKHGIKLGFMSFFAKAVTLSVPSFPQVNGQIDGPNILIHDYVDLGIAVSTPKGLMVPVIRDAQRKSIVELEREIARLAAKARENKITIEELTGGTFSITNGGVFGSMLSTPIINPPQSAILGMHNIVDRPVAVQGKVEIRPVMYVALSYDHRMVDGRESVSFLVKVKEYLENPLTMLFPGQAPEELLLSL
jgi:2-oxoglutarate dehydrogenase E2 component (dihydrolipoamide succinyltransferase)